MKKYEKLSYESVGHLCTTDCPFGKGKGVGSLACAHCLHFGGLIIDSKSIFCSFKEDCKSTPVPPPKFKIGDAVKYIGNLKYSWCEGEGMITNSDYYIDGFGKRKVWVEFSEEDKLITEEDNLALVVPKYKKGDLVLLKEPRDGVNMGKICEYISKGNYKIEIWGKSGLFKTFLNEKFFELLSFTEQEFFNTIRKTTHWELKPGDMIEVSDTDSCGWVEREFFCMDGSKYVCRSKGKDDFFTSWKLARPIQKENTITFKVIKERKWK